MYRNQLSGFETPFLISNNEDSIMEEANIQSGQKSPNFNDSPNRDSMEDDPDYLDLNEVNVNDVIAEIDSKMKERIRTVTVKESLILFKTTDKKPGFIGLNLRFNPTFGSERIKNTFESELKKQEGELLHSFAVEISTEK